MFPILWLTLTQNPGSTTAGSHYVVQSCLVFCDICSLFGPTDICALKSITLATPPGNLPDFKMLLLFGCGSVLLGGAECTWNNLLDRKIDSKEAKDVFKALLESANVEYEWNLTANVESAVERVRDRKDLFESYLAELKKKEKAKAHEEHKRNIREYKQSCDFIKSMCSLYVRRVPLLCIVVPFLISLSFCSKVANSPMGVKFKINLEEDERCLRHRET
ncbi:hypothetical protein IFM89_010147 [Coptis chinensis]|uniref:Uncharacterized protein n=1 Tax=Coptis chinensis TaxID=261450 RepID=A0A835LZV3_9MAGN|nr:hypothetical protein IFM89_010147 [Coptis chinensis]